MPRRTFDVPVDVPLKSEVVQNRFGMITVVIVLAVLAILMFIVSVNLGLVLSRGAATLPDVKMLESWRPSESTRILDRHGTLIANIHGDEDRVVVPIKNISPWLPRAIMAIEDNRFYHHNGVDLRGTTRALIANIKGGDVQGGSTITQQLAKNLFLTPERSIGRKLAEALLAMRLEQAYEKDRILEMYMNQVYWGNQAYGAEKAARRYFKKAASELNLAEAALLAGLLKAPEGLSPYLYPEANRLRQLTVLDAMERYGYITEEQHEEAIATPVNLNHNKPRASAYPYFVAHVIQELVAEFGEDIVRRGGLVVTTTLDQEAQKAAEKALIEHVKNLPDYTKVTDGALVAIDTEESEILAMVGGIDFQKSQFNNATQMRRAAGSTFKPIVYLTGMRKGLITPESKISDKPIAYPTGSGVWRPKNWDGRFMGEMTIRKALTLSRNTTTVQVGMKVGIDSVIETAHLAGITSDIDRNSSSFLGSSGISPLEMATVYTTFARHGIRQYPTVILSVEDSRGYRAELSDREKKQVFNPSDVAMLNSILVDVVEKGTGKRAQLKDRKVAGKTGTTDRVRDIWFSGFTPDMAAVVWMGNKNYVPLRGVFSSNAATVWHDFAKAYYDSHDKPASEFLAPGGGSGVKHSKQGALLPTPKTAEEENAEITDAEETAEPSSTPTPSRDSSSSDSVSRPQPVPIPQAPPPEPKRSRGGPIDRLKKLFDKND